jgi:uncharacterized protein YkwD
MKNLPRFLPSILIITVLLLLIFSIHVPAQPGQPDEQILLQMTAYARKIEDGLKSQGNGAPGAMVRANTVGLESSAGDFAKPAPETLELEKQAFDIVNKKRIDDGLEPLHWSDDLARLARLHSENMARHNFFSHTGRDGKLVSDRADEMGIKDWNSIGENIAFNRGFKKPAESACEHWMQSPSHRANILDRKWRESGIGMAIAPDGSYYFTQVFILK